MRLQRVVGVGALVSVGVLVCPEANAQRAAVEGERPSRGGVWFNPLGLIFGLFSADVGISLNDRSALNFGANYWSFELGRVDNTSFGFGAGWQYFFTGQVYDGFFVMPNVQFEYASVSLGDDSFEGVLAGPGALAGYQWDWHPFSLRLGAGFHYYFGNVEGQADGEVIASDIRGMSPDLDASLGFTW